jgi:hypothetical protein
LWHKAAQEGHIENNYNIKDYSYSELEVLWRLSLSEIYTYEILLTLSELDQAEKRLAQAWQKSGPHLASTEEGDPRLSHVVQQATEVENKWGQLGEYLRAREPDLEESLETASALERKTELRRLLDAIDEVQRLDPGESVRLREDPLAIDALTRLVVGLPEWAARLSGGLTVDQRGYVALVARQSALGRGGWVVLTDRKPIPTQRWVHYAGVIAFAENAAPELALYRDGADVKNDPALESAQIGVQPDDCTPGVYIGGLCSAAPAFYRGRLEDLRIWERALDAAELRRWQAQPGVYHDEVAYWPLDDGPGRRAARGACAYEQSCNLRVHTPGTSDRANDRYHLPVYGPAWVEAGLGETLPGMGGGQQ